jgi:hypothetical protein
MKLTKDELIAGSIVGYFQLPSRSLAEANPEAYNHALRGLPADSGYCHYCGRGITNHVVVQIRSGRTVFIGTDCAGKVGFPEDQIEYRETTEQRQARADRDAATDWDVVAFGKHTGKRISELVATERGYVEWLAGNASKRQVRDAANAALAPLLAAENKERQDRTKLAAEAIALVDGLKRWVTSEKTSWGAFIPLPEPVQKPCHWASVVAESLKSGNTISRNEADGAAEEVTKNNGFSRRGKKNQAAWGAELDRVLNVLEPFIK